MIFLRRLRQALSLLFHGDAVEAELDAEVQAFYQTMVDRYVERGIPEREARRLARIEYGHPENVKEEVRDSRTGAALASTMRDVNYALRGMRKAPLFACVTVLTLGVGIGANTTIFSVVSRFVLRPPPVGGPATLMALHTTHGGECCNNFSWPIYSDLQAQANPRGKGKHFWVASVADFNAATWVSSQFDNPERGTSICLPQMKELCS